MLTDEYTANPRPRNVEGMRRKAFKLLSEAGIDDRADRHALATFLLNRRIRSWTEFDETDWCKILDAVEGWYAVEWLRQDRARIKAQSTNP